MADNQVVFTEIPQRGIPARFIQNGRLSTSSPVVNILTDNRYPGWYKVITQSGNAYIGQVNLNPTQPMQTINNNMPTAQPAVQVNVNNSQPYYPATIHRPQKDKMAAALFAFFLGGFGVHRFYLGQTGLGFLYLCFCWTFIPGIVAFIDFIIFLCMSPEEFAWKYCS